jgi:hypothetical protein
LRTTWYDTSKLQEAVAFLRRKSYLYLEAILRITKKFSEKYLYLNYGQHLIQKLIDKKLIAKETGATGREIETAGV